MEGEAGAGDWPKPAGAAAGGPPPGRPHVPSRKMRPGPPSRAEAGRVPVTGAVGADDAGEILEGTNDLAASPRLEVLDEQQLQATHGCAGCATTAFSPSGGKSAGRASRRLARGQ